MSAAGVLFLMPKTVRGRAGCLPGTSEQRTPAFTHPRQGGPVGVPTSPREETDVHILQLSHFSHSLHLIYLKLWVLEALSYYREYLLESTSTIIPTLQVPFISKQETLKRLALSLQARNERQTLAPTVHPDPLPHALPSIPIQALPFKPGYSEKFAQFNCEWQKWWRFFCRLRVELGAFMSAVHTLPTQSNSFLLFSGSFTPPWFSAWL